MVQQPLRVVETQQQGADFPTAAQVSKAPDHAIGGPQALDLDHRPLAAQILSVEPLGDHPVSSVTIEIVEPLCRLGEIARARRDDELTGNRGLLAEGLERASSLGEGRAPTGEPSGPITMSNRMSRAGVSTDSRRIRLAAGCSRACNASKVIRPFSSMTNSPSTTNRSNGTPSSVATTSGKKRPKDVPDFPLISTALPCLKARQRKPSHFGSNCHSSGSFGSASADLASIGPAPSSAENKSGHSTPASFGRSSVNLRSRPAAHVAQRAQTTLVPKRTSCEPAHRFGPPEPLCQIQV